MTVGSFKARFNTPCSSCGANISPGDRAYFVKGEKGYWCEECDGKRTKPEAETPTAEAARQSSITKAHEENLASARQTRDMIAVHAERIAQLDGHLQALIDVMRSWYTEDQEKRYQELREGKA